MASPSKKEILSVVGAQSETIDELSNRILRIEKSVEKQDSKNSNVIIAVVFAVALMVAAVAVSVILSDRSDRSRSDELLKTVYDEKTQQATTAQTVNQLQSKLDEVSDELQSLRTKNPYLK